MLNSFYGLEMGKRALNAFRLGLQTVGHNVSNMKTAKKNLPRGEWRFLTQEISTTN